LAGWRVLSPVAVPLESWVNFKEELSYLGSLRGRSVGRWLVRYTFSWAMLVFESRAAFGYRKAVKARRLPRRQTKRVVKQAQVRFWVW
jgi:hypothetical protein